ncbi:hypothetical protein L1987_13226 [Smallanthus sonchifolius]|uniref:Uncharacterized protein n=1 Tax=Smallanthus sonchifolius TaxID=185202 RepID=A0ACB9JIM7_9ASTR|nr:hypothetical protein L1987_13226 [Smallanthus sonchifolius]
MVATKGIMDYLLLAVCEWFLMFWMFVEGALAYSLTRFAKYCQLHIPCLLCSRLDQFFGNEEAGSYSYMHLFCKKHQTDISYLMYCNLHNELEDVREMCADCSNSASLQTQSNLECYRSFGNRNFVCDPCSCCKSQWKEKSTGQQPIWSNVVGSRGSKATTKPPLPRVARHGRSKRSKNKVKHRHRNELSPVGQYSGMKFTSDSEFEFIFSDNDDGGFKVVGISERSLKNDTIRVHPYKVLGRHSHSTPDLTSTFLLEAQLNESSRTRSRTRSASLTPNCLFRCNLAELNRKTEEFDPLKIYKDRNRLSSMNHRTHGSLDGSMFSSSNNGSQNRNNIFSRHSFSASDLGSAIRLEMHKNNRLRQRSASLTPNILYSSGHGLGEHKWQKNVPSKVKKPKKLSSGNARSGLSTTYLDKTNGYGYLDDSVVSCNKGNRHNRSKIPRRHSYSVFQLGGEILLNMPTDEGQSGSICGGLEEYKKSKSLAVAPEPDFLNMMQFPQKDDEDYMPLPPYSFIRGDLPIAFIDKNKWYGSLDDSAITRNRGIRYQNSTPRRHSHCFSDLGREFLLNMPINESLTYSSASFAPRGSIDYAFKQPNNLKFQTRPNPSVDFVQFPHRKNKRGKKSSSSLNRTSGYESMDDLVVSFNTDGIHDRNNDPRRHSYSAFELGCALLLNDQPIDNSLTNSSVSMTRKSAINHGFGEANRSGFQTGHNPSHSPMFLNKNQGYGFLDDSVVSFNTGIHDKNNDPRRHSYSAFEPGCALLLNDQPIDKSLTNSSAYGSRFGDPTRSGFQTGHNPSHSIMFLNKNQGYGFLDDSVVTHKMDFDNHNLHHNQNKIPQRHSYSMIQLGGDILLNMPLDESLTIHSFGQSSGDPQKSNFQKVERDQRSLPPTGSVKRFGPSYDGRSDISIDKTKWHGSFDDYLISRSMGSQSQSNMPRRHSHSAFDLGRALLLEINLDNSLKDFHASLAPNGSTGHGYEDHHRVHRHKAKRHKNHLPPPCPTIPLGSSSDHRNDLFTVSLGKTHGVRSLDDSLFSHKTGNHIQNNDGNPRRHSYSAFELGCALLLNMQRDASSTRRSASLTPKIQIVKENQPLIFKKHEPSSASVNIITDDLSSASLYKPHGYQSCDESVVSNSRDGLKRCNNLTRNYYSVSDLTSPVVLQMNHDEGLRRKSASLTPDCVIDQALEELNSLKFQTGSSSSLQIHKKSERAKAKRRKRSKVKRSKKPLQTANNVKIMSSDAASDVSYESFDDSDAYESFDDSDAYESNTGSQNRYNTFSRNSRSASDLGSVVPLEVHPDDRSRNRSKSLTPNCSYFQDSIDPVQFLVKKRDEKDPTEVEKGKKQLPRNPTKEMDSSSTTRAELCPSCSDKFDLRSLDGSIAASEIDYDGVEKVKRQAEDDVRCMRLLQSELEAERNAATVAANHAMNMITRLQQEKASLQMEALQYLRMMEEQAEYDMEALQKANELVEEKENEIQDLLNELEQYRNKYGDEQINNIKSFDDEKRYILDSLSKLEKKINQLSNGAHDKSQENEKYDEFSKLEHEILDMKEKMEALQADLDLIKHQLRKHPSTKTKFLELIMCIRRVTRSLNISSRSIISRMDLVGFNENLNNRESDGKDDPSKEPYEDIENAVRKSSIRDKNV